MADIPPYPLYNRTYHLYRLSPLHTGDASLFVEQNLRAHARRLKDQLKGDNVRGVEVGFAGADGGAFPKLGPLEDCVWDTIGDEDAWIDRHQQLQDPEASHLSGVTVEQVRGVEVVLEYDEKHSYNALLLRDPATTVSPDGFTSLPLLLLKMPGPIREIFLNYLKTTFDVHISPLKLPPAFLTSTLETYFNHLSSSTSSQSIRDVIRQLQLQLSFPSSTSSLKHIDVTIAGADVPGFVNRGKLFRNATQTPFTTAISSYLLKHLTIDLSNPKIQLSRISCGSFTLATDRLKLLPSDVLPDTSFSDDNGPDVSAGQLAMQDFYNALVREAAGSGKFLPDDLARVRQSSTPSSAGSPRLASRNRKRAVSNPAVANNNTKRTKARGKENTRGGAGSGDVGMSGA